MLFNCLYLHVVDHLGNKLGPMIAYVLASVNSRSLMKLIIQKPPYRKLHHINDYMFR